MRSKSEFESMNKELLRKEKLLKSNMKMVATTNLEIETMERSYINEDTNEDTEFFVGTEVENVRTKGMKTLFVVGIKPVETILSIAKMNKCQAVYFGANHSFSIKENGSVEWDQWTSMIRGVLDDPAMFWCVLDLDLQYQLDYLETGLSENIRMIPVISVKVPYIEQLGYNAVIKIDDIDFNKTNPGVWCHNVHTLMDQDVFTHWQDYSDDERLS